MINEREVCSCGVCARLIPVKMWDRSIDKMCYQCLQIHKENMRDAQDEYQTMEELFNWGKL
jgi:hypothetical protein